MTHRVLLPKIRGFKIVGFRPIFDVDVEMSLGEGPGVILGGNGLGKTTIMQAVAYGLAGGTSKIKDEDKSWKWDHKYFHGRIDRDAIKSAHVEVAFNFGSSQFSLRRGFNSDKVIAFRNGNAAWIEGEGNAHDAFKAAISEVGNYKSEEDFAFIFHRLLYLPETRQLLAWDSEAQLRALMLLNQDIISEDAFRRQRIKIRELDSVKRHVHVAIGKVKKQVEEGDGVAHNSLKPSSDKARDDKNALMKQLKLKVDKRIKLEAKGREAAHQLNNIATEVEKLREEVEEVEASLSLQLLHTHEKENNLALTKLTSRGICPSCGTKQKALQDLALQYQLNHQCTLCGSDEPQMEFTQLSTSQNRLHEKVRAQKTVERKYIDIMARLDIAKREENEIEYELSKKWYASSDVEQIERGDAVKMGEDPRDQLDKLEMKELELGMQLQKMKRELENAYAAYVAKLGSRLEKLRDSYQDYATRFLGTQCLLDEVQVKKPIPLSYYIPYFNSKTRPKPESCSEAQRFFLDIAFRMAVIDYACDAKEQNTIFMCETPETALDYSYINNVIDMFQAFISRDHSLLVSSNIQLDSIAGRLVKEARSRQKVSIVNLLELGQLSDVQKKAKTELDKIVNEILGEA